jgi:pseudaminic acid biosynthesis-associated methylase
MRYNNSQEKFWSEQYSDDYIKKNSKFNIDLGLEGWNKMLAKTKNIKNLLECGCNIGRNINLLEIILPEVEKSVIEISSQALEIAKKKYKIKNSFNGPIINAQFDEKFDLVFTMGVLIHIHPNDLIKNMSRIYDFSTNYILIGEYFNRTPISIKYQGEDDRLFKNDFGKIFQTNFNLKIVDYGFLWGHIYDTAGFDDFTWWLFQK